MNLLKFELPPACVGYWEIPGNIFLGTDCVPSRWRRFWARALIGWKWNAGHEIQNYRPELSIVIGYGLVGAN